MILQIIQLGLWFPIIKWSDRYLYYPIISTFQRLELGISALCNWVLTHWAASSEIGCVNPAMTTCFNLYRPPSAGTSANYGEFQRTLGVAQLHITITYIYTYTPAIGFVRILPWLLVSTLTGLRVASKLKLWCLPLIWCLGGGGLSFEVISVALFFSQT